MSIAMIEEVARKLGGKTVLGVLVGSQADLALAVRNRLPLAALKRLVLAGLKEQEIERFCYATAHASAQGREKSAAHGG